MKPNEIQDLINFIASSGLDEVNIETENFKLSVKKNAPVAISAPVALPVAPQVIPAQASLPAAPSPAAAPANETSKSSGSEQNLVAIKSPMIGTFYRASSPTNPLLVNVGDEVKKGQTVCIIEAMKLFNEIESEISGRIVKVLVENASPVEYDQPLFLVEPA